MRNKLKVNLTRMENTKYNYDKNCFLSAGIFVSEVELQKVAGKLKMFDEIAARLKISQARSEGRIVQLERDLETVQLENVQFRKQINNLNKMINVFNLM